MRQFATILAFELKNYLKNKVFVGVTLFLVLAIALTMFFPRLMNALHTGDAEPADPAEPAERAVMLVQADSPERTEQIVQAFSAAFPDYRVQPSEDPLETVREQIVSGEAECAFAVTGGSYTYYVENLSLYDDNPAVAEETLSSLAQVEAMIGSGVPADRAGEILTVRVTGTTESLGVDQMQNFFYTYIMIFALYMAILLYGQMVATNVASEKSSRAMEVLITSAKPVSMMFGKVIASCLAGLIQLVAVFGSALVCFRLNRAEWADSAIVNSIFNMPPALLGFLLIFFVLGFFLYAFLYGAIGSTASKLEDINTSVMPVTMLFIVAFFVVFFSLTSGSMDSAVMRICSFVPFTSPMAMFTRIAMSTVPWYEIALSVAVLLGSVVGVGVIAAKIYRVGVLLYGTRPKLGALLRSVWKA